MQKKFIHLPTNLQYFRFSGDNQVDLMGAPP